MVWIIPWGSGFTHAHTPDECSLTCVVSAAAPVPPSALWSRHPGFPPLACLFGSQFCCPRLLWVVLVEQEPGSWVEAQALQVMAGDFPYSAINICKMWHRSRNLNNDHSFWTSVKNLNKIKTHVLQWNQKSVHHTPFASQVISLVGSFLAAVLNPSGQWHPESVEDDTQQL